MDNGTFRIAIGQMECKIADIDANLATIEQFSRDAVKEGCDLVVFPELAVSGYALGPQFADASLSRGQGHVKTLLSLSKEIGLIVGCIEETESTRFFNSALYLHEGEVRHVHRKVYLPNYRIFHEKRYFGAGLGVSAFDTPWARMAILICGDAWHLSLPYMAAHDGADVLITIAASSQEGLTPEISVRDAWLRMNQSYALTLSNFVVFANRVGDEDPPDCEGRLEFWGGSHILGPDGNLLKQAAFREPELLIADLDLGLLRKQRLILPFRRDDSLAFTIDIGRRVLRAKHQRRDGFLGLIDPSGAMRGAQNGGERYAPPPAPRDM